MARTTRRVLIAFGLAVAVALTSCSSATTSVGSGDKRSVVAAENFWGSIASQLGGAKVSVTSIIDNPNATSSPRCGFAYSWKPPSRVHRNRVHR